MNRAQRIVNLLDGEMAFLLDQCCDWIDHTRPLRELDPWQLDAEQVTSDDSRIHLHHDNGTAIDIWLVPEEERPDELSMWWWSVNRMMDGQPEHRYAKSVIEAFEDALIFVGTL